MRRSTPPCLAISRPPRCDAELIRFLFQTSRDMLMVMDFSSPNRQGSFWDLNDVACEKLGYTREELLALGPVALLAQETTARLPQLIHKLLRERAVLEQCVLVAKDGSHVYVELHIHLLRFRGQRIAFGIARDISDRLQVETAWRNMLHDLEMRISQRTTELMETNRELQSEILERVKTEQELADKEQRLRLVTDNMLDLVAQVDSAGRVQYLSPSCKSMLGYEPSALLGSSVRQYIHEVDLASIRAACEQVLLTGSPVTAECRVRHARGHWLWIEGVGQKVVDQEGRRVTIVATCRDVTNRRRMEQQLKFQAVRDPVTGLHNRTYFELEMGRMADGALQPAGLIICDLDGLKYVNDTLGHDAGDNLLATAADILRDCFGKNEIIARIGGDEFAIILPKADEVRMSHSRSRIRAAIAAYNNKRPKIPLNVSIGSALTGESISIDGLFKAADNSMYREKLHSQQSSRSSVVHALKKALEVRDYVTEGHANRLRDLTVHLAKICGLPDYRLTDLRLFAEFHDIGKVGIPDQILFKPGPLTKAEVAIMHSHCEIGHRIAISSPDLEPIADWILMHHEWWNGKGYPNSVKGQQIPIECRILSIADAYDAMTNDRPYRKALTHSQALAEILRCSGEQFDPELVERFAYMLKSISPSA
ncbi:MAG TPA: PAS domain S-box protein [Selenomonadales bacterium]|nr:PAS domain S-box protein [Selenomonadales bacterium]